MFIKRFMIFQNVLEVTGQKMKEGSGTKITFVPRGPVISHCKKSTSVII